MRQTDIDLDEPLLQYGPKNPFTIRDSFEGVQIFGSVGSGKSSGSGQMYAKSYLRAGFGGLALTAKSNE